MMIARFTLYKHSWRVIFFPRPHEPVKPPFQRLEAASLCFFASWVITVALCRPSWAEAVAWVLLSHAVAGILHVQIIVSHWAMETYHGRPQNDASDEWFRTQLKTTMDVKTHPLLDWVHIGLQFQIEHHMYPRLPRHSLRAAREGVIAICKRHSLQRHEPSFWRANVETVQALRSAASSAFAASKDSDGYYRASGISVWASIVDASVVG
jgi:acyl-lipid Delta6-acetylenase / acyl-lipid (9-3)-desaturase